MPASISTLDSDTKELAVLHGDLAHALLANGKEAFIGDPHARVTVESMASSVSTLITTRIVAELESQGYSRLPNFETLCKKIRDRVIGVLQVSLLPRFVTHKNIDVDAVTNATDMEIERFIEASRQQMLRQTA